MKHLLVLPAFLALTACGPVSLVQAEAECRNRADQASGPHGSVAVGLNSDGQMETEFSIGVTGDYLSGRDPSEVYNSCVYQRSGQMPSRPYFTLPPTR